MIRAVRIRSESLMWPLAETGPFSPSKPRKSRAHASLPTRSTDSIPLDNPVAWLFLLRAPSNSASFGRAPFMLAVPTTFPSPLAAWDLRSLPFPSFHARRRNRSAAFSASTRASRPLPCGAGSDTSFSTAVSRGHGRLATSPAPWRHGAPLLSRHAGPLRVSGPSQKDWPALALAIQRISSASPEKAQLDLGSRGQLL